MSKPIDVQQPFRILDAIPRPAIATDLSGTIVHWNPAAAAAFERSAADALGKSIDEVLPDQSAFHRSTVDDTVVLVAMEQTAPELARRETLIRELQQIAHIVTWEIDLREATIQTSDLWSIVGLGSLPAEMSLEDALKRVHPADVDRLAAAIARSEADGTIFDSEHRYRDDAGAYRVMHARGEVINGDDGRPARISGYVQDITDRRRLEERLQQAERISSIGRLAASVAHEFNNVLMGIQPFAELIARRAAGDEAIANAAEQIASNVVRGKRVTQDILRFTRTPDPVLQPVDVATFMRSLEAELQQIVRPRVRLEITQSRPLTMLADRVQLQLVLSNLVVNAVDAMPDGGNIRIEISGEPGFVHFAVRDSGAGMSQETLTMIFQPLFTTKKIGGTGLGLAIVYQVVRRHNGEIWAESEEGRGSTFHVRLPATAEPALVHPRPEPVRPGEQPAWPFARIALIEDDAAVAEGISTMLELDGVAVRVVHKGREAVDAIASFEADAVILDVGLPDLSGASVYQAIAERWPNLPVLFSTGHGDERLLGGSLERPHVGYLQKPYELDELLKELCKLRDAMRAAGR